MMNDGDVITKVWMLLDIIHKASAAGPAYAKWAQAAQKELENTHEFFSEPQLPLDTTAPEMEHSTDE